VLRALDDPVTPHPGATDSAEATRFKTALRELHQGLDTGTAVGQTGLRRRLGVVAATTSVLADLRADETVPRRCSARSACPSGCGRSPSEFIEAMAYPVIDLPMYQPLLDLSVDAFVPNLNLVPPNSITLLENNREFIESYLVGLNHEMARELLWREYPTDQRGTPFRQFWDPARRCPRRARPRRQRRERGYDIPPIHKWPPGNAARRQRQQARAAAGRPRAGHPRRAAEEVPDRGDLRAQGPVGHRRRLPGPDPRARPGRPRPDRQPRRRADPLPLYEAKVEPDIYLLGFDLTADEARGGDGDAGWFFVLKERPGDPRFGVDDGPAGGSRCGTT
jgi:hypothetical protein